MRLRNLTDTPIKMVHRTNAGKKVKYERPDGSEGVKPELPKLVTIHIGPGAEVEIEDDIWHALWKVKGQAAGEVEEHTEEHLQLKGNGDKPLELKKKVLMTTKTAYVYRDMVKKQLIEITEKPAPEATNEQMVQAIREAIGVNEWKPKDQDHLIEMYDKVIG